MSMSTKTCIKCEKTFPVDNFFKKGWYKDGSRSYHPYCKPCHRVWNKEIQSKREAKSKCSVEGCDKGAYRLSPTVLCNMHWRRVRKSGQTGGADPLIARGTGWLSNGYKYIYVDGTPIREHRYVMEQHLGRKLLPEETVHHIDGDKLNNSLENLELWSSSHPAGQRVEDKVAWAEEILRLYAPDKLS